MGYINFKKFSTTISKKDIHDFVQKHPDQRGTLVQDIQHLKDDTVKRLFQSFSHDEIKPISPQLVKGIEKEYFELLQKEDQLMEIRPDFEVERSSKEIEQMFKAHEFDPKYIENFQKILGKNILEISKENLFGNKNKLSSNKIRSNEEQKELKETEYMLRLLSKKHIENTKSRSIYFDDKQFSTTRDAFAVECFFEQDTQGNKNYFCLNDLLNDLETFGVESGYPVLDTNSLGSQQAAFATVQKRIKLALTKNILAKYRDYQEVVMYNLKDYEKHIWENNHHNREGILAEKIVERAFRHFANLDDKYHIQVKKASIGQDQKNKIDLIIQIQDKKSGVNIQKELQLTIDTKESVLTNKQIQIQRQKQIRKTDLDLLKLELHLLGQKTTIRRNMERPVGGIYKLLSFEDKEFLEATYQRIIDELKQKISK